MLDESCPVMVASFDRVVSAGFLIQVTACCSAVVVAALILSRAGL